jgi:hypothetical protein
MIGSSSTIFLLPLGEGVKARFGGGGVLDRSGGGAVPDVGGREGAFGCGGVIIIGGGVIIIGGGVSTANAHTIPLRQLPFTLRINKITMTE